MFEVFHIFVWEINIRNCARRTTLWPVFLPNSSRQFRTQGSRKLRKRYQPEVMPKKHSPPTHPKQIHIIVDGRNPYHHNCCSLFMFDHTIISYDFYTTCFDFWTINTRLYIYICIHLNLYNIHPSISPLTTFVSFSCLSFPLQPFDVCRSLILEGADVAVAKPELCTIYVCLC